MSDTIHIGYFKNWDYENDNGIIKVKLSNKMTFDEALKYQIAKGYVYNVLIIENILYIKNPDLFEHRYNEILFVTNKFYTIIEKN